MAPLRTVLSKYKRDGLTSLVSSGLRYAYREITDIPLEILSEAILRPRLRSLSDESFVGARSDIRDWSYGEPEEVTFGPPEGLNPTPGFLDSYVGETYTVPRPFVSEVRGGRILGYRSDRGRNSVEPFLLTNDGHLLVDGAGGFEAESSCPRYWRYWSRWHCKDAIRAEGLAPILRDLRLRPQEGGASVDLDAACSLVSHSCLTYGHWILNYLPKLQGLEVYEERTGVEPHILIDPQAPNWMVESLQAIGFEEDRILPWPGQCIDVDRLVVPSPRFAHAIPDNHHKPYISQREQACGIFAPSGFEWLRSRLSGAKSAPGMDRGTKRFYISRNRLKGDPNYKEKRFVLNENELVEALKKHGFSRVFPEEMSFREQVALFSDAEVLFGPCGSGLNNMIFSTDCKVVEMFGTRGESDMVGPYQYAVATSEGRGYACVQAESKGDNLIADIDQVEGLLRCFND